MQEQVNEHSRSSNAVAGQERELSKELEKVFCTLFFRSIFFTRTNAFWKLLLNSSIGRKVPSRETPGSIFAVLYLILTWNAYESKHCLEFPQVQQPFLWWVATQKGTQKVKRSRMLCALLLLLNSSRWWRYNMHEGSYFNIEEAVNIVGAFY